MAARHAGAKEQLELANVDLDKEMRLRVHFFKIGVEMSGVPTKRIKGRPAHTPDQTREFPEMPIFFNFLLIE